MATYIETLKKANGVDIILPRTKTAAITDSNNVPLDSVLSSFGRVDDVTRNGVSIVENKIAKIILETGLGSDSDNSATVTAIRAFVNSSIESAAAYYITSDSAGDAFATKASLDAGPWYYAGVTKQPTRTDYAIVITDETHSGNSARYTYVKQDGAAQGYWNFQYTFNMQFTQAQINVLNSGITAAKVALYDAHIASTNNPHGITKTQVGLSNVADVLQYSASNPPPYPVVSVAGKTGTVTLNNSDVGLGNVVNTGDSATPVSGGTTKFTTGGAFTELAKKQNVLTFDNTPTQNSTNPVKSGGVYSALAGKQSTIDLGNKLSSDLVDDTNQTNKFVTTAEKTSWNSKSTVTVSDTGTSTTEAKYITIDDTEYKLSGGANKNEIIESVTVNPTATEESADFIYNSSTRKLFFKEVYLVDTYTITPTLSHVTASGDNPATIDADETATLVFTAATGYELPDSVTVTGATGTWTKSTGTLVLSNATANVTFSIVGLLPQMATPQNISASGTTISFDPVENAESYEVFADGESIGEHDPTPEPTTYSIDISYDNTSIRAVACATDENGTNAEELTAPYVLPIDKPYLLVVNDMIGNNTLVSSTGTVSFRTGFSTWSLFPGLGGALLKVESDASIVLHQTNF